MSAIGNNINQNVYRAELHELNDEQSLLNVQEELAKPKRSINGRLFGRGRRRRDILLCLLIQCAAEHNP